MDAAREHLWGQLLLERNLVAREDLSRLATERDALIQRGQDSSLGQMLVQHRRLDAVAYATITREVEGRGRACYGCRRVFLAPRPDEPPSCPQCGGDSSLRPTGAPGMSGRFMAPSLSGRFPAQAVPGSSRLPIPGGTGSFPAPGGTGFFPAQPPPATGSYGAPSYPPPPATGSYPAANGWGAVAGAPHPTTGHLPAVGMSGKFQAPPAPGMSGGFRAVPPPPSGGFNPVMPPSSGGFNAVQAPYDPVGASYASPQPQTGGFPPSGPPPSTASDAGEISSGELGVGKRFGKYEIVAELGRGGMGVVYKVRCPGQPGFLAVKVLLAGEFASPKLMERFREEAKLAKRLRHPNIVAVHDVGEVDGIPYYAMDYIEGSELQDLIRQKNLPVRRGVEILVEVARAAHHAHENGVVHRDLKPSNILISSAGTSYIMDFGLAKNLDDDKGLTRSGVAIGTPYYMPPEQARGSHREMDARSDVYALGAILFEVLTRRVPFSAKTQNELLRKIVEEEPQPPRLVKPGIPNDLDTICLKALRKAKDDRYESALAMAEDLERWLAGKAIHARPEPLWSVLARRAKKNKTVTMAIAGVALLTVLSGVAIWQVQASARQDAQLAEDKRKADEAARVEAERLRLLQEAEDKKKSDALVAKQQKASEAARRGLVKAGEARQVTTVADAMRSLEEAEQLLSEAVKLERELTPGQRERASTAYQRALVRRALCRWNDAREDFTFAAKDPTHQARAHLARGLIKLRWECDRDGARVALGDAVVARNLPADAEGRDEEATAEGIARAYLAYLQSNADTARLRLLELASARNVMAAEANAALAFLARCEGAPLGGDQHVDRGTRPADQAVLADAWRYDFLVDRSILRARGGNLDGALNDLRAARALFPDGEMPDLAEAVVSARRNDTARMQESLRAAEGKARRSQRVTEEVSTFARRLANAPRTGLPPVTNPDRPLPPNTGGQGGGDNEPIRGTSSFRANFPPTAQNQTVKKPIVIPDDAEGVRLSLRGAPVDLDIFVYPPGDGPLRRGEALWSAETAEPDETLVISRSATPPLRSGQFTIVLVMPQGGERGFAATLEVQYYKKGEPMPHAWRSPRELLNCPIGPTLEPQVREADRLRPTDLDAACARLKDLERIEPRLAIIRASWFATARRYDDGRKVVDGMADKDGPSATYLRVLFAMEEDKPEEARRHLVRLLELRPEYLDLFLLLTDLHLKAKDAAAVVKLGEQVQRIDPLEPIGGVIAAAGAAARGNADGVEKLRSIAQDDALSIPARIQAMKLLHRAGHSQKALELVETARANGGDGNLMLEIIRAECLAATGKAREGIEGLRQMRARLVQASLPPAQLQQFLALTDETIERLERESRGAPAPTPPRSGGQRQQR